MKKTIAMLLVLVMVLSLGLSACGNKAAENTNTGANTNEVSGNANDASGNANDASDNTNDAPAPEPPETVESLIQAYSDKAKTGTGMIYSTDFTLKMAMEVMGQSQTMEVSGKLKTETKGDITHVTGTMAYQQDDENETADTETWTVRDGEKTVTYTKTDGTWSKQDSDFSGYFDNIRSLVMTKDYYDLTLSETDNEYLIQGTVEIGTMIDMLKELLGGMGELGDFDAVDLSKVTPANVLYRFDKATKDLTYCEMDLKDCYQDMMDQLIKVMMDQFMKMGEDAEEGKDSEDDPFAGIDISSLIKINTEAFSIKTTDIKLDPDLKLELPEEARNASEPGPEIPDDYAEYNAEEMTLHLPDDFEAEDAAAYGYNGLFGNDKSACVVLREDKTELGDAAKDLAEYAALLRTANSKHSPGELTDVNGHPVFEYTVTADGKSYSYYTAAFESEKAFWMVQFFSLTPDYEELKPVFADCLDMVSFTE